jgi:hypothetical protein
MFPLYGFIITLVLGMANNNMLTFKQYLIENSETPANFKTPAIQDPFEGNDQLKSIYRGIVGAEHTAAKVEDPFAFNKNLYIRTKAGGGKSSAYGPVQITASTAKGFMKTQPKLFKGIEDYTNQFVTQGSKMLKADIKDPKYGLGCVGDLCDEKQHLNYQKMAVAIIKGKAKEKGLDLTKPLSDQDLSTFVGYWRGADEKSDPRYFKSFREGFKKVSAPAQPQQLYQQTTKEPESFSTLQTAPSR